MDIELFVKSQKCTKYAQVNLHHLVLEYLYFLSADEQEIREIKHRVFFSRERQRGSRDLTFPAFAVCRPPFLLEENIFPFGGNAKTCVFAAHFYCLFLHFDSFACFYSYASFIILLLHELLVRLKEFQIQAENT